jgi:putative serine protease PepD
MVRKWTAIVVAGAALAGAGVGVGSYAAAAGGGSNTTAATQSDVAVANTAATTTDLSVSQIYQSDYKAVVEVTATGTSSASRSPFPYGNGGGSSPSQAQGSGFVYDTNGDIVTNYHVIQGASTVTVTFYDGSKYTATVVGYDASTDLAVLKVDAPASKLSPLTLADSSNVQVGDGVVAIGSPFGLEESVSSGIVSALDRTISSDNSYSISGAIQTDAAINPGNSGGPLLNMQGQVIGVTSQIESSSGGNDGVGFAISSNTIHSVVSQLINGGKAKHAYLGVSVQTPANSSGAEIASVTSGSPAANAGLKAGDVVTAFGGETITSPDDLTSAVSAKQPGDKVTVTYIRNSASNTTNVTLGTRAS